MFKDFHSDYIESFHLENPSLFELDNSFGSEYANLRFENFIKKETIDNIFFLEKKRLINREIPLDPMTKDDKEFQDFQNFFDYEKNFDENEGKIFDTNSINCIQSTKISHIFPRSENEEKQKGNDFEKLNLNKISTLKEENQINEDASKTKLFKQSVKKIEISKNDFIDEDKRNIEDEMKGEDKILFNCKHIHTPGRKRKNKIKDINAEKFHSKTAQDNIVTKIQTYFITFIISLANDIIQELTKKNKNLCFKDIDYKIKKKVKSEYMAKLKDLCVKDILQNPVSSKFRSTNINFNKIAYDIIININNSSTEVIKEYFNMNYLTLFEKYINNCNPLNKINIKGKDIYFSEKTKSFYYLLKKNDSIKNELIGIAKKMYLKDDKYASKY